jgi:hypothetical protein
LMRFWPNDSGRIEKTDQTGRIPMIKEKRIKEEK